MEKLDKELFDKVVKVSQSRGFVFNASSIYGGLRSSYDYGPLGTLLKQNISKYWWQSFNDPEINIYPVDTAIIQSTDVWKSSGHLEEFTDPMVECKSCNIRFRSENEEMYECCDKQELTEPKSFNLMFETHSGPVKNQNSQVFLRPETAQGIFINFENVLRTMRAKIPFGIANIGKSFRNEITPGQFIFRTREFEQMEIEFFCKESEEEKWMDYWIKKRMEWYQSIGIKENQLQLREHDENELAHYAKKTVDIEYLYPWGWGELEGIANRGNYDLLAHQENSGKDLSYFDSLNDEKYLPSVIEPAGGLTRTLFALLLSVFDEEKLENDEIRTVFRFKFELAPIQIGILPLSKKDDLIEVCNEINKKLKNEYRTEVDVTQSIGKRYRRQDEIGTPYCITVDFDSLEDNSVTIRDRDTMKQERISIDKLSKYFEKI
ncbi:MAG: glycine--tRNA ligase [Actinomycetota bacterium]|nr:glycine--tRNA ligase [Actinomycetota bacterium]